MASSAADLNINLDAVGQTVPTPSEFISSRQGRIVVAAVIANYDIEKTAVTRLSHQIFLEKDVAVHLRKNPSDICRLTGIASHDKAGAVYNTKVAQNRAEEAAEFLLRRGVADRQIFFGKPLVRGAFGIQDGKNRAVVVEVMEPLFTRFSVRMVTWNDVNPMYPKSGVALVIEGGSPGKTSDVKGYFYFFPVDEDDIGKFTPNIPSFGGPLRMTMPISLMDFDTCRADFVKLPPDMVRVDLTRFLLSSAAIVQGDAFINNVSLNWDGNRPVLGSLHWGRTDAPAFIQPAATRFAQQSQMGLATARSRRGEKRGLPAAAAANGTGSPKVAPGAVDIKGKNVPVLG